MDSCALSPMASLLSLHILLCYPGHKIHMETNCFCVKVKGNMETEVLEICDPILHEQELKKNSIKPMFLEIICVVLLQYGF